MSTEQPEQREIDVRDNPESKAASASRSSLVARASDGGAPPREAPAADELPEQQEGGTAAGSPVDGVTISSEDRDEAVQGDDGPNELDGPTVSHA